jgi:sodium-dependent dicarboxylate transporter 2/3/5
MSLSNEKNFFKDQGRKFFASMSSPTAKRILLQTKKYELLKHQLKVYSSILKVLGCLVIPMLIILLPADYLLFDNFTVVQHRVIFIFSIAAIFWIVEPIPIFATSVLIILLELLLVSDGGLNLILSSESGKELGQLLNYKEVLGTFASPIIFLFLGGFFLAIAATKYKLDQVMAKTFIKPFGTKPQWVMLGLMIITAIFSMFMSNTATTAMMLSILAPVLAGMDIEDKGKIGFVLCIPIAANIGGLGTPIGTPPNALAMKYLQDYDVTFSLWMLMAVPFVITLLLISWLLLLKFYKSSSENIVLKIEPTIKKKHQIKHPMIVYGTFTLTVLLWLTDFIHGLNAYIVAFIPIVVFLSTEVLGRDDLKLISWDVLWLVSGGLALGLALDKTGLAQVVVASIPFDQMDVYLIFLLASVIGLIVANFMSNTATANLLLPLIVVIGTTMPGLESFGGAKVLIISTTLCISLGMALPISTPPNALAYSTGLIKTADMSKMGVIIGVIGVMLVYFFLFLNMQLGII